MQNITQRIARLIAREGGYVNHPNDRGGPTKYGITEQVARAYNYGRDMRDLSYDFAVKIYRLQYWERPGFDAVATISEPIAEYCFDYAVHSGPKAAISDLQQALNALNRQGMDYDDITTDGHIGPMTLAALDAHVARRGAVVLNKALQVLRGARLINIAERDQKQEDFLVGWLDRAVTTYA